MMEIRPATDSDSPHFEEAFFADRLARQNSGRGWLLTGWHDAELIGHLYIRVEPPEQPAVRIALPAVPFIQGINVAPPHQGNGHAKTLVTAAERLLHTHGHTKVGIAVPVEHVDAARLFTRLGYREQPHSPISLLTDIWLPTGRRSRPETCFVLIKPLR
ncbi:GNAT family N-acetyltransferase [Actinocrispum sp. NPDC049592]|uniref:GNAT family N-acetyltransferase n=1 Tax=Actinocrispum sp. NPDC049592 TaxID=3154835 RepID=UPI00343BEC21